jgi:hypothetical protein
LYNDYFHQLKKLISIRFLENLENVKNQY